VTLHLIIVDVLLSRLSSNYTSHTIKRCDTLWAFVPKECEEVQSPN
jgi:hypothetical protein